MRYPIIFIQEFYSNIHGIDTSVPRFATTFRGTRIIVTPNLISEVLHVPRIVQPDYPNYERLRTMSRDELLSHFCETPSICGGKQNTSCSGFAKGPRFLNMVMTFNLTPLYHYNSITEPRACFLLSLFEDLFIDFLSHFITSILDVYQDMATHLQLSRGSFATSPSPFLTPLISPLWVPSALVLFDETRPNFDRNGHGWRGCSCFFCCSSLLLGSFHLYSFFFGSWCDLGGHYGAALAHGCSP